MIMRLKGVIAHSHDTKIPRENSVGWGTRPNPKVKPFEEDSGGASTCGWGNRPNPEKDPTLARGWRNRLNPKKESHVRLHGRLSGPRKAYNHFAVNVD